MEKAAHAASLLQEHRNLTGVLPILTRHSNHEVEDLALEKMRECELFVGLLVDLVLVGHAATILTRRR